MLLDKNVSHAPLPKRIREANIRAGNTLVSVSPSFVAGNVPFIVPHAIFQQMTPLLPEKH